jgi:(2Fe-2S) ferredoxin
VYRRFLDELDKVSTTSDYQLANTGCLGSCGSGVAVLVYPGGVLYGRVTPNDVAEIVAQHLIAGKPVTRLIVEDIAI